MSVKKDVAALFPLIPPERNRDQIPRSIVQDVHRQLVKDFGKGTPRTWSGSRPYTWNQNPIKGVSHSILPSTIDVIRVKNRTLASLYTKTSKYYTPATVQGFKHVDKSCIVVDENDQIVLIYMTAASDPLITKAVARARFLVEKMRSYHKKKRRTFYNSGMDGGERGYYGENYMDGMIRAMKNKYGRQFIDYQPRKPEAMKDKEFLYDLVYTYSALYELEKRYAPAVAEYRKKLVTDANYPHLFPGVPLDMQPATGVGASVNFASRIHKDSSMIGTTETIMWTPPSKKGEQQMFVLPELHLVFELSKQPCVMLISPEIVHGTVDTGDHGGYGFVSITKKNLLSDTEYTQAWYEHWHAKFSGRETL